MRKKYVIDYAVGRLDGTVELSSMTCEAADIFSAAEKAKDMVEDYKNTSRTMRCGSGI